MIEIDGEAVFNLGKEIEAATPDKCDGCHTPFLRAQKLGHQVVAGEITREEADSQFKETMEDCKFGRLVGDKLFNNNRRIVCGMHQLCGDGITTLREYNRRQARA